MCPSLRFRGGDFDVFERPTSECRFDPVDGFRYTADRVPVCVHPYKVGLPPGRYASCREPLPPRQWPAPAGRPTAVEAEAGVGQLGPVRAGAEAVARFPEVRWPGGRRRSPADGSDRRGQRSPGRGGGGRADPVPAGRGGRGAAPGTFGRLDGREVAVDLCLVEPVAVGGGGLARQTCLAGDLHGGFAVPPTDSLHDLVGELSTRSDDFRTRWGAHDVRHHGTGTKRFHHPAVGDLTLAYEGMNMAAAPGLTLTVYTAEPGSASEQGLRLLATWAATREAADQPNTPTTS